MCGKHQGRSGQALLAAAQGLRNGAPAHAHDGHTVHPVGKGVQAVGYHQRGSPLQAPTLYQRLGPGKRLGADVTEDHAPAASLFQQAAGQAAVIGANIRSFLAGRE